MKGLVVYDTYYGNTKTVAEAIVEQLRSEGHEAELRSVREKHLAPPNGDIMFLGSPIRLGSVPRNMKKYLKNLDSDLWKDRPIAVFSTILVLPENATDKQKVSHEKYDIAAGRRFVEFAKSMGFNAVENHLWVEVKGMKGPLVETWLEKTKQFAHDTLLSIKR